MFSNLTFIPIQMKYYKIFLCLSLFIVTTSCGIIQHVSLKQGVSGQITMVEGNLMPGPGKTHEIPKGVKRNVFIYEVVKANAVEGQGPLYSVIPTRLVAKISTDALGFFQCKLKAGRYSVFTQEEDKQFFSGLSNEMGELSPIEVLPDSVVNYTILINYKAVY